MFDKSSTLIDVLRALQQSIVVYSIPYYQKKRFGSFGDGGYILLQELAEKAPMLFSYGVGDDISFEKAWCESPSMHDSRKLLLCDSSTEIPPLPNVINDVPVEFVRDIYPDHLLSGNPIPEDSILKLDVEGSEFSTNFDLLFTLFSQIVVEFHFLHVDEPVAISRSPYFKQLYTSHCSSVNEALFLSYTAMLQGLFKNFYCFHIHANNSLPPVSIGDQYLIPLLELSFARKDLVDSLHPVPIDPVAFPFPDPSIDAPNKKDRGDYVNIYPLEDYRGLYQ